VIKLRAVQVNSLSSPLQFVSVERVRDDSGNANTTGIAYKRFLTRGPAGGPMVLSPAESGVTIEAELNDDPGLSAAEQRTTVHELGHALGLDHPGGNPEDPAFDDRDTIMSYNVGGGEPATWFSESDLLALKEIWGAAPSGGGGSAGGGNGLSSTPGEADRFSIDAVTGLVISGFESGSDKLVLSPDLPGLRSLKLKTVGGSRKKLIKALAGATPLVYWKPQGDLFLNANGKSKGFGEGGGAGGSRTAHGPGAVRSAAGLTPHAAGLRAAAPADRPPHAPACWRPPHPSGAPAAPPRSGCRVGRGPARS
jgi:hypothetical protein